MHDHICSSKYCKGYNADRLLQAAICGYIAWVKQELSANVKTVSSTDGGEDSDTGDPFLEFHHFDDDDFDVSHL